MALTKISGHLIQQNNFSISGVVTATSFSGPLTGNVNSTGVSTFTTLKVGTGVTISSGIVTATTFSGNLTGNVTGNATGLSGTPNITVGNIIASSATISGNVSVAGTVTYDDVTNVDSLGVGTFRSGIVVNTGTATTALVVNGDARVTGILTVGQSSVTIDGTNNKITTPKLDYAGISSTITTTAVDVFVYDTRKDSDGGAWRKRTQHTSWYNETLNTATRGSRREFPAVAVIVATSSSVTIYDGDDPDMPMWMVFQINAYSTGGNLAGIPYGIGYNNNGGGLDAHNVSSVYMMNGQLFIGGNTGVHAGWSANFLNEIMYEYLLYPVNASNTYRWTLAGNISQRNTGEASTTTPSSRYSDGGNSFGIKSLANDVAMTVLPNAPIDSATGLPIPTIAVATNGGVSVIKDDGTVVDSSDTDDHDHIILTSNRLICERGNASSSITIKYFDGIPSSDGFSLSSYTYTGIPAVNMYGQIATDGDTIFGSAANVPSTAHPITQLQFLSENKSSQTNGMVAYATTSYNTGWMHGDIKGAFLSDTDATNVTGSELVTNGTFDSNISGWTDNSGSGSSISWSSGTIYLDGAVAYAKADQQITTVVGKTYVFSAEVSGQSGSETSQIWAGTAVNTSNLGSTISAAAYNGVMTLTFTATTTTTWIRLYTGWNTYFDNVSVRIAELDRSVNNKGLAVYGTITKTAVATGADLVAYSGWSTSNYLRHRSSTNYGSSATISFMAWQKTSDTSNYQYAASVWDSTSNKEAGISIGSNTSGYSGVPYIYDGTNSVLQATGISIADGNWHFVVGILNGTTRAIYVDGVLRNSAACTSVNLAAVNYTNVGHYTNDASVLLPYLGSLALVRISASAPSAEQIKKIYEDEKVLFQENAKCTLYGSSDAVTALAYDDSTNLLYAGTSSGRSDFQGLRRINNTTTAVTTAMSASNGLVAEQ